MTIKVDGNHRLDTIWHMAPVLYDFTLPPMAHHAHTSLHQQLDPNYNDGQTHISIHLLVLFFFNKQNVNFEILEFQEHKIATSYAPATKSP